MKPMIAAVLTLLFTTSVSAQIQTPFPTPASPTAPQPGPVAPQPPMPFPPAPAPSPPPGAGPVTPQPPAPFPPPADGPVVPPQAPTPFPPAPFPPAPPAPPTPFPPVAPQPAPPNPAQQQLQAFLVGTWRADVPIPTAQAQQTTQVTLMADGNFTGVIQTTMAPIGGYNAPPSVVPLSGTWSVIPTTNYGFVITYNFANQTAAMIGRNTVSATGTVVDQNTIRNGDGSTSMRVGY